MKKRFLSFVIACAILATFFPSVKAFAYGNSSYSSKTPKAYSYLRNYAKTNGTYMDGLDTYFIRKALQKGTWYELTYDVKDDYIAMVIAQYRSSEDDIYKLFTLELSDEYWNSQDGWLDMGSLVIGYYMVNDAENGKSATGDYKLLPRDLTLTGGFTFSRGYSGPEEMKQAYLKDAILGINDILTLTDSILKTGGYTVQDLGFVSYKGHVTHRYWNCHTLSAPTCVEPGFEKDVCYICGAEVVKTIPALSHQLGDDAVRIEPTATQPGSLTGECSVCKQKNASNEIPPIFTDTVATSWYAPHVDKVYDLKLMNGTGEHTFAPNANVTRAMAATVLYRIAGEPEVEGDSPFKDVPEKKYYTNAVIWAAQNGVVAGFPDGTFRPDDNITREQLAALLYRCASAEGKIRELDANLDSFPDAETVHSCAKDAMLWAVGEGLINGDGSGGKSYLQPANDATRAQFATIISRYMSTVDPLTPAMPDPENPIPTPTDPDMPIPVDPDPTLVPAR